MVLDVAAVGTVEHDLSAGRCSALDDCLERSAMAGQQFVCVPLLESVPIAQDKIRQLHTAGHMPAMRALSVFTASCAAGAVRWV